MNLIVRKVLAVAAILVVTGFLMAYVIKDQGSRASDVRTTATADPSTSGSDATADSDSSSDSDADQAPFGILPASKQETAPDFTVKTADGASVTLSHAVKRGYVILDFWASYCGPCKMELPDYESLYKKYGTKGVQFYTVNSYDTPETIKMFASSIGLTMPMLVDDNGNITNNYGVNAIPLTLVIDKRRKVVAGSMGYDPNMTQDLPATLDKLIAQKS